MQGLIYLREVHVYSHMPLSQNIGSQMKYMVAIPIPKPAGSLVANLKSKLRPAGWHDTMPPHITLLSPDRPALDLDDAARSFSHMKLPIHPAAIHASKIGRFDRASRHTIILLASPRTWLTDLQSAVLSLANWQSATATRKHNYEPHITLVNQTTVETAARTTQAVIEAQLRVEFVCREIVLYTKRNNWPHWRVVSIKYLK
jgi:2'-5' RNA ligase